MTETIIQNATTSHMQSTYTQHSCTLMSIKSCLQSHQDPTSGIMRVPRRRSVETKKNVVWLSQSTETVAPTLNYHPLLTYPSCCRNDELNINISIHVCGGLLFGPKSEVLRLVELLPHQILMRIVGRMEKLSDQIFFLGRILKERLVDTRLRQIRSTSET